jgi:hypothetical protein
MLTDKQLGCSRMPPTPVAMTMADVVQMIDVDERVAIQASREKILSLSN